MSQRTDNFAKKKIAEATILKKISFRSVTNRARIKIDKSARNEKKEEKDYRVCMRHNAQRKASRYVHSYGGLGSLLKSDVEQRPTKQHTRTRTGEARARLYLRERRKFHRVRQLYNSAYRRTLKKNTAGCHLFDDVLNETRRLPMRLLLTETRFLSHFNANSAVCQFCSTSI